MRTGRPTLDKKEQTLKLRLNDSMRGWIEQRADAEGVSMSEYIRRLVEDDIRVKKFPEIQKDPSSWKCP